MQIEKKLLSIFLIISLIPILLIGMLSVHTTQKNLERQVNAHVISIAQSRAHHIRTILYTYRQKTELVTSRLWMRKYLKKFYETNDITYKEEVFSILKALTEQYAEFINIVLLDTKGAIIVSSEPLEETQKSEITHFAFSAGNQSYSSSVGVYDNAFVLYMSAPLFIEKELIGVAVVVSSIDVINQITSSRAGLQNNGEVFLVNEENLMITPSRFVSDSVLRQKVETPDMNIVLQSMPELGTHYILKARIYKNYRGIDVLGSIAYLPEMKWFLFAEQDLDEAFSLMRTLKCRIGMCVIATFLCVVIVGMITARSISNPIKALQHGVEIIRKGNLNHSVATQASDEIGQLSRAFDAMVKETNSSQDELRKEISNREEAEQALQNAVQQLSQTNKDLEEFAYIASHDLKLPLFTITGYLEMLERINEGKLDDKSLAFIESAQNGASRMEKLIDDLLMYAQVSKEKKHFSSVDCSQIVQGLMKDLHSIIQVKKAVFHCSDLPVINGNESLIKELFQNLLTNALKYSGENGVNIDLNVQRKDDNWLFSVCDTGKGIHENDMERIFEPFQRGRDNSESSGTGIGLAICKKIVSLHGGTIWVESTLGKGATFFFTIPLFQAQ